MLCGTFNINNFFMFNAKQLLLFAFEYLKLVTINYNGERIITIYKQRQLHISTHCFTWRNIKYLQQLPAAQRHVDFHTNEDANVKGGNTHLRRYMGVAFSCFLYRRYQSVAPPNARFCVVVVPSSAYWLVVPPPCEPCLAFGLFAHSRSSIYAKTTFFFVPTKTNTQ